MLDDMDLGSQQLVLTICQCKIIYYIMEEKRSEAVPQEGEFKMKKKPGRPRKLTSQKLMKIQ